MYTNYLFLSSALRSYVKSKKVSSSVTHQRLILPSILNLQQDISNFFCLYCLWNAMKCMQCFTGLILVFKGGKCESKISMDFSFFYSLIQWRLAFYVSHNTCEIRKLRFKSHRNYQQISLVPLGQYFIPFSIIRNLSYIKTCNLISEDNIYAFYGLILCKRNFRLTWERLNSSKTKYI